MGFNLLFWKDSNSSESVYVVDKKVRFSNKMKNPDSFYSRGTPKKLKVISKNVRSVGGIRFHRLKQYHSDGTVTTRLYSNRVLSYCVEDGAIFKVPKSP
jgi:hypothetical protein